MEYRPGLKSRVIARVPDLRTLFGSLQAKPFAISPPIKVDSSFMMGLASEAMTEGLCIHLPLSALWEVAALLFTNGDRETPIHVHSLKQLINWFYRRNIRITTDRFRDVSIAAYLLKPPEADKGEDWQNFLLSSMVRNHLGQEYPFVPGRVEQEGYPQALHERLSADASLIWQLGEQLPAKFQSDLKLNHLYTDVEIPMALVFQQ